MYDGTPDAPAKGENSGQAESGNKGPLTFEEMSGISETNLDLIGIPEPKKLRVKSNQAEDVDDSDDDGDIDGDIDLDEGDDDDDEDSDEDVAISDEDEEESEDEETQEESEDDDKIFLETKVDGKLKKFTKEQVTSMIASGWHTKERSEAVEGRAKQVETFLSTKVAELETANSEIKPAWEAIQKKDVRGAVEAIAEKAGMDVLQTRRTLVNQIFPEICQRLQLPPEWVQKRLQECAEQNKLLDLREEKDHLEGRAAKLAEANKPKEKLPEEVVKEKMFQLQVEHGISNAERNTAIDFIQTTKGDKEPITAEYLVEVVHMQRATNKGFAAIRSVRKNLETDNKFVDLVVKKAHKNAGWTQDRLVRWVAKKVRERANAQRTNDSNALQRDISRKVLKGNNKSRFENPNAGQKQPMRFEDIDPETFGK